MTPAKAFARAVSAFGREGTAAVVAACVQTAGADMLHDTDEIIAEGDLADHATKLFAHVVQALTATDEKPSQNGEQEAPRMFEDA